jgi:mannose-1-phosphate guanylyltransferase
MFTVVMAGGSGTRFWPMSRRSKPKQFLNISGKAPLIVETCDRMKGLSRDDEIIVVLGENHLKEAKSLLKERKIQFIAEPIGRNTAPCIGLGAIFASHLGCEGPIAFLPADHFFSKPDALLEDLRRAAKIAESGVIVTLGIVPTRPETGYGYIQWKDEGPDSSKHPGHCVSAFVEKPTLEKARQYIARGDYFWNAGIFVATPQTILREIEETLPLLYRGLIQVREVMGTDAFDKVLKEVYEELESISFDYGVMEKTRSPVSVVPSDCGWSDVGSWQSLYELRETDHDAKGNLTEGECLLIDCKENLVSSAGGRMVACLGLQNLLVIDTGDAILIANLNNSQSVRTVTERLKKNGREDLL